MTTTTGRPFGQRITIGCPTEYWGPLGNIRTMRDGDRGWLIILSTGKGELPAFGMINGTHYPTRAYAEDVVASYSKDFLWKKETSAAREFLTAFRNGYGNDGEQMEYAMRLLHHLDESEKRVAFDILEYEGYPTEPNN